jgi:hypothetical protein
MTTNRPGGFSGTPFPQSNQFNFNNPLMSNPLAQMGLQAFGSMIHGGSPGQFNPGMPLSDQMQGNQFNANQLRAMQEAGRLDRPHLTRMLTNMIAQSGNGGVSVSQQQAAERAGRIVEMITTNAAMISPELVDQIGGVNGLAVNLARGVSEGLRYSATPHDAGAFSTELHQQLYGANSAGNLRDMNGLGGNMAGQLFEELSRRGLLRSQSERDMAMQLMNRQTANGQTVGSRLQNETMQQIIASDPSLQTYVRGADVARAAEQVQNWSGAVASVRDLLQAHNRPAANMTEIFNLIEDLTQGAGTNMNPGHVQMMIRRAHQLSRNVPGGLDRYINLLRQGGRSAQEAGLDRSFGASTAAMSMAFGNAFAQRAGRQGPGGLTRDDAESLDMQLRHAAAASPMANMLGAVMALKTAGKITAGSPADQIATAVANRDMTRLSELVINLRQPQLRQLLEESGVSPALAGQYLRATDANQAFVQAHGIDNLVRQLQGQGDIARLMRSGLQSGMGGVLREAGLNRSEITMAQRLASEAARQALMGMDGELLSSTEPEMVHRKSGIVAEAIGSALPPDLHARIGDAKIGDLALAAIRGLEGSIQRNPGLRRFRNLAGVVSMHSGEVVAQANEEVRRASAEARIADLTSGLGQVPMAARLFQTIATAGPDTNLREVISQVLGGVPQPQIIAALEPIMSEMRADRNTLLHGHDDAAATRLRNNSAAAATIFSQLALSQADRESTPPRPGEPGFVGPVAGAVEGPSVGSRIGGALSSAIRDTVPGAASTMWLWNKMFSGEAPMAASSAGSFSGGDLAAFQQRDMAVRAQEESHFAAAGPHAAGPPQYNLQTGPDGRHYATSGHVPMDVSSVRGDPDATIRKMRQIQRAALGTGATSANDVAVANRAMQLQQRAALQGGDVPMQASSTPMMMSPTRTNAITLGDMTARQEGGGVLRVVGELKIKDDMTAEIDAVPNRLGSPSSVSSL